MVNNVIAVVNYVIAARPSLRNFMIADNERARVLGAYREYFNICSEEIWLYQQHRIDRATWAVWERGMQQVAMFPCFQDAWESLAFEYDYFGTFRDFVREKLLPRAVASEDPAGDIQQEPGSEAATSQEPSGRP